MTLAPHTSTGRGVTQDESRGLELVVDACHGGEARARYQLGQRYRVGNRVTKDLFKAVALLEDACPKLPEASEEALDL